ncbi:MAG: hypothetical protein K6E19_11505 [Lachnospiraceae bacterium]|nr:hypothetical protein [Lachnospiraceae bacterium]
MENTGYYCGKITSEMDNGVSRYYILLKDSGEKIKADYFGVKKMSEGKIPVLVPKEIYDRLEVDERGVRYLKPKEAKEIFIAKNEYDKLKDSFYKILRYSEEQKAELKGRIYGLKDIIDDHFKNSKQEKDEFSKEYIKPLSIGGWNKRDRTGSKNYFEILTIFWETYGRNKNQFNETLLNTFFGLYKLSLPKNIIDKQSPGEEFKSPEAPSEDMPESIKSDENDTIKVTSGDGINNVYSKVGTYNSNDYVEPDYSDDDEELNYTVFEKNLENSEVKEDAGFTEQIINSELDNESKSLLINVAQNFAMVICAKPGTGKKALCEEIMKCLCKTSNEGVRRYQTIPILRGCDDQKMRDLGHDLFDQMNFEAEELQLLPADKTPPLSVVTLRNATTVPVEDYFDVFLSFSRGWYGDPWNGEDNSVIFGGKTFTVPETLRFILSVNDDRKGCFSEDVLRLVNVVEVDNPLNIKELIRKFSESSKPISYKEFKECYEDTIDNIRLSEQENEEYYSLYKQIISRIEDTVFIDKYPVVLDSRRNLNAVSRYWDYARKVFKSDGVLDKERVENELLPQGMVIDEDCLTSVKFVKNNQRVPEIIALDYAVSQRIISYFSRIKGKVKIRDASDLFELLLENKLYKCSAYLKNAVESARVRLDDELGDETNEKLIIKKCGNLYDNLLKDAHKDEDRNSLLDHITDLMNQCRDKDTYTRNVIANIMICLSQGFLTIFSGKPGCGKTSICRIIGEVLGLANNNDEALPKFLEYKEFKDRRGETVNPVRFIEVSTERGWTSKHDFIGHYNSITEQFNKVNALLYNAFVLLDKEAREDADNRREGKEVLRLPCFILLDEANLSPMEYYWADFMNLCEADWRESNTIDLGGGKVFKIPEGLHFVATINNDHTTEILSPRLIDRANVIDLPAGNIVEIEKRDDLRIRAVSWEELKSAFCPTEDALSEWDELRKKWKENNQTDVNENPFGLFENVKKFVEKKFFVSISPRTEIAVSRYWVIAKECFEKQYYQIADIDQDTNEIKNNLDVLKDCVKPCNKEDGAIEVAAEIQAADYAIAQRILPKLTDVSGENAFDDLIELMKSLYSNKLYKSMGIVADLILRGYDTGFYNYFR